MAATPRYKINRRGGRVEIVFPGPDMTFSIVFSSYESAAFAWEVLEGDN